MKLELELSDEQLAAIAEHVAVLLTERQGSDSDGWLRGAGQIANYIGSPRSRVYGLASAGRIPVLKDGSALIALRSELDAWLRNGGGVRP